MTDLTHKQQQALDHELRKSIYSLLQSRKERRQKPVTLGTIAHELEARDVGRVHYHLQILVDAELVEKVPGTYAYRAVDR